MLRDEICHFPGCRQEQHLDAKTIRTIGGGEGFNLHNCVQALFTMTPDQDQQAA